MESSCSQRLVGREAYALVFGPMFTRLPRASEGTPEGLLPELRAFLDCPPVNSRTDDNKTLVLATRLPGTPAREAEAALEA